jgi:ATPase subunit of ABC transporter with duplicated ATPase domains
MPLLRLRDLGVVSPHVLFQNLSLDIAPGQRLGLVAGNGQGKSTLLRCLAGQAEADHGSITRSRGLRIGFVEQDVPPALMTLSLHEAVRRALPSAVRAQESWRVDVILDEFGATEALRQRAVQELSGGWQRLGLLARIWVTEPDLLLLDEPTNHLDADKLDLLEAWIAGTAAETPMLIASHHRSFLDACTTHTLFLRPESSRHYAHPYTRARQLLAEDEAAEARKFAKDSQEVDRLRRHAADLRNVGVNSGSDLLQKKAMQLKDRAARLEQGLRTTPKLRSGEIRLATRDTHAKILVALRNVVVSTPTGAHLFRIDELDVRQGDRLILAGANGAGKSSLVALLRQAFTDEVPGIRVSPSLVLGHVDQAMAHLPETQTPHRLVAAHGSIGDQRATSLLASAGIGVAAQNRTLARLSPGQKARLSLLLLRITEPNFYLLDEPTNHIDIPGQERLEEELVTREASGVIVSHDRSFTRAVGTRFLRIAQGRLTEQPEPD